MTDIDVLLEEHRKFKPPEAFRSAANVSSPEVYARAAKDYEAFWAECARALEWSKPIHEGARVDAAAREVVLGR